MSTGGQPKSADEMYVLEFHASCYESLERTACVQCHHDQIHSQQQR